MSDSKFKAGDTVYSIVDEDGNAVKYNQYDDYMFGEVVAVTTDSVTVVWSQTDEQEECDSSAILLEDEFFDSYITPLELEFKVLQDKVNDKLGEAYNLILEAANMAKAAGSSFQEMDIGGGYTNFFVSMDDGGWESSTFGC